MYMYVHVCMCIFVCVYIVHSLHCMYCMCDVVAGQVLEVTLYGIQNKP